MGNMMLSEARPRLWLLCLAAACLLPGTSAAFSSDVSITSLEVGHVDLTGSGLAGLDIDPNDIQLPGIVVGCNSAVMYFGSRVCTSYQMAPGDQTNTDAPGDVSSSDDDRYFINPTTKGHAALKVDLQLGASLLAQGLDRLEVKAEVGQAHAGAPVYAYAFNNTTGLYTVVGTYTGLADGLIRMGLDSSLVNSNSVTLLLINADLGIRSGQGQRRAGMYVDAVGIGVTGTGPIPEPSAALLTGLGLLGLAFLSRPRRK